MKILLPYKDIKINKIGLIVATRLNNNKNEIEVWKCINNKYKNINLAEEKNRIIKDLDNIINENEYVIIRTNIEDGILFNKINEKLSNGKYDLSISVVRSPENIDNAIGSFTESYIDKCEIDALIIPENYKPLEINYATLILEINKFKKPIGQIIEKINHIFPEVKLNVVDLNNENSLDSKNIKDLNVKQKVKINELYAAIINEKIECNDLFIFAVANKGEIQNHMFLGNLIRKVALYKNKPVLLIKE
ncbi:MAG: hypothetical protein ACOC3V_03940 [bacterium]